MPNEAVIDHNRATATGGLIDMVDLGSHFWMPHDGLGSTCNKLGLTQKRRVNDLGVIHADETFDLKFSQQRSHILL